MNRYPLWKYILIVIALLFGALYSIPNIYPDAPALQISSGKSTVKVEPAVVARVEEILRAGGLPAERVVFDSDGAQAFVRARFADTTTQFKAKALLERSLNADVNDPTYLVAFNLLSTTPAWMQKLHALPMYLGLDLRGGVHFLLEVDTRALIAKQLQSTQGGMRSLLREENIRHNGITRANDSVEVRFADADTATRARNVLANRLPDFQFTQAQDGTDVKLTGTLRPEALKRVQDEGVEQNVSSLSKRINELGVSEPIIQRQGASRIVVQLPGVQDVAHAKDIIGRTATLEVRATDDTVMRGTETTAAIPMGSELFTQGKGAPVVLSKEVVITGDYISGAQSTFDQQQQPVVSVQLNPEGGRKMRAFTRYRVGKPMAIVLFEKGKGEVISVANVNEELGANFQISGGFTPTETAELALLLRAGSLAAPMSFIEERTIGPQLGAENIRKGFNATLFGFLAIAAFMIAYYMLFGFFSVLALAVNVLLLIALLSMLNVVITLPGIAAIALALGMAIDANVLINERIREELRLGASPQAAINAGFERAWATILDSNVTTLIVGLALLVFGSGAIRGFALVHSLGILTSMFSAVFVSRGAVNLWYGRKSKKKVNSLAIGTVWKAE